MRLVARMADDMGINIQVGRYSTVSINLSNILEFYLVVVEKYFLHASVLSTTKGFCETVFDTLCSRISTEI